MCRNIKTLFTFDPPVTDEEIRAASLQFVRRLSGFTAPSKVNEGSCAPRAEGLRKTEVLRYLRKCRTTSGQNSSHAFPPRRPSSPMPLRHAVWLPVVMLGGSHVFSIRLFTTLPA